VQTDEYWQDIDAWSLEQMRRRLRSLIKLIEGDERHIVYTDFEDEIGEGTTIELPDVSVGTDKARFQMKVRHFLKQHADHITIQKLRRNEQLTPQDLTELERIMIEEAGASNDDLAGMRDKGGLGLFVRSLVGLERDVAKAAFADFMADNNLNANQIEFINLIVDHLTESGAMDPRRLYESPFTDFDDQGVSGVFRQPDVQRIVQVLNDVRERAAA
jgi:type I restriction enzyme R subunit